MYSVVLIVSDTLRNGRRGVWQRREEEDAGAGERKWTRDGVQCNVVKLGRSVCGEKGLVGSGGKYAEEWGVVGVAAEGDEGVVPAL